MSALRAPIFIPECSNGDGQERNEQITEFWVKNSYHRTLGGCFVSQSRGVTSHLRIYPSDLLTEGSRWG